MPLLTAIAGAQSSAIPRTPWGDPDLQGTYTKSKRGILSAARAAEKAQAEHPSK